MDAKGRFLGLALILFASGVLVLTNISVIQKYTPVILQRDKAFVESNEYARKLRQIGINFIVMSIVLACFAFTL